MFEVLLTNKAEKALKALSGIKLKRRIEEAIDNLAYTYFPKGYDIKKLKGVKNTYRLRIGGYRIIYAVDFKKSKIFILALSHRERAY